MIVYSGTGSVSKPTATSLGSFQLHTRQRPPLVFSPGRGALLIVRSPCARAGAVQDVAMLRIWILLTLLSACAEQEYEPAKMIRGPDGRRWWEMECESRLDCSEQLAANCPHGYTTRDEAVEDGPVVASSFGHTMVARQERTITMLFRCKGDK